MRWSAGPVIWRTVSSVETPPPRRAESRKTCLRREWKLAAAPLLLLLLLLLCASAAAPGSAGEHVDDFEREVLDMSPESPAAWGPRYVLAPFVSLFRGVSYMYAARSVEIDTTPSGGYLDLFYVRSGFQKRYEQAEAPLTVLLPPRLEVGPRDSLTIRAFADGYRQQSVTFKLGSSIKQVNLDLEPLPNLLDAVSHRYFAGRSSIGFLTKEALTFRVQQAEDGLAVILTETAVSEEARLAVGDIRSPLIGEAYAQQLGEDLMVKLVLTERGLADGTEVRSRQSYDAPRRLHEFGIDLFSRDGGAAAVTSALAALGRLKPEHVRGCALAFDEALRRQLDRGELARALAPRGAFTDRYLRAAMRRLGEVSVDGVVDFADGTRFRPSSPIELELSLGKAGEAKGYLALLRRFAVEMEGDARFRREALRSLVAPELAGERFASILDRARVDEEACVGGAD